MDNSNQATPLATPPPFDATQAVAFGQMSSRCGLPEVRAEKRDDPFDTLVVDRDRPVHWYEREECGSDPHGIDGHASYTYLPAFLVEDENAATARLLDYTVLRRRCIALLGLCYAAGVVTIEQAACVIGIDQRTTRRLVRYAFAARLIDLGLEAISGSFEQRFHRGTTMLRLNRDPHHKAYLASLSHVERLSILGAGDWPDSTGRSERHDVHALEFALRAAEFTPIAAIVGERFATWRLILGPAPQGHKPRPGGPDYCFIRGDGARILVEHTASDGTAVTRKVHRLVELLAHHDELIVLLVVATDHTRDPKSEGHVLRRIGSAIEEAVCTHPGHSMARTRSRIAVVRWRDYFPYPGHVHSNFTNLVAYRRTEPSSIAQLPGNRSPWERVSLLSIVDMPIRFLNPPPLSQWLGTIAGLGQTPHWMRSTTTPNALPHHLGNHLDPTIAAALQLPAGTHAQWVSAAPRDRAKTLRVISPAGFPAQPVHLYATAKLSPWNPYDPLDLPPCPLHHRGMSLRRLAAAHLLGLTADRVFAANPSKPFGMTTLLSILACAKDPVEGKFLRLTPLREVLAAQDTWNPQRALATLREMSTVLEQPVGDNATLGWLLDPRSDGRRPIALLIAVQGLAIIQTDVPWDPPQLG